MVMRAVALVGGDTCVMRRRVAVTPRPLKIKSKILLPTCSPYFSYRSLSSSFSSSCPAPGAARVISTQRLLLGAQFQVAPI
jgi:hypothetical protein